MGSTALAPVNGLFLVRLIVVLRLFPKPLPEMIVFVLHDSKFSFPSMGYFALFHPKPVSRICVALLQPRVINGIFPRNMRAVQVMRNINPINVSACRAFFSWLAHGVNPFLLVIAARHSFGSLGWVS